MSSLKSLFLLGFVGLTLLPSAAKADIFYWKSPSEDVSVTFPDRWGLVNNHQADEILRIAAPAIKRQYEEAQCRIRVREDGRFKMHPVSHSDELQRVYFSQNFWDTYVGEFSGSAFNVVQDDAGLGRGFASYADITYMSNEHPKMLRRGIAFASLYQNKVHIFECSAEASAYLKWYPQFMGILKSVDFKPMNMNKNGFYRNYYAGTTTIQGPGPTDLYTF